MTPFSFSAGACIHNRERASDCDECSWTSVVSPQIQAWLQRPRKELSVELGAARELLTMAHCEIDELKLRLRGSIPLVDHLSRMRAVERELESRDHAIAVYKERLGLAS